jgi:hypothetical protein
MRVFLPMLATFCLDSAVPSHDWEVLPPFLVPKQRSKPTYRPHSRFTAQEDVHLYRLVDKYGTKSWRLIAKHMPSRNSRQCRERWLNYLNPSLNNESWTAAEDALLGEKYNQIGPRWVYMMRFFPNRTDAMLKNRFQVLRRKAMRHTLLDSQNVSSAGTQGTSDGFEPEFSLGMHEQFSMTDPTNPFDEFML